MKNSSSPSSGVGDELKNHGVLLNKNSISPVILEAKNSLDHIYKVSSRLNRSFLGEGSIVNSSIYIVPLILFVGLVFASTWLLCACVYYNMKGKKFKLPCRNRKKGKVEDDPPTKVLTPAMLQIRRQERLAELQAEHSHLEQQLTESYLSAKDCDNNVFLEEKGTRLTSRASDSDLEYLNNDSPPLKRNSISLQDLPQSVIRLRREKELRTLKTEIEYLKKVSEISSRRSLSQSTESVSKKLNIQPISVALAISPRATDARFPGSSNSISSAVENNGNPEVVPLSQHISQLKTQRRLNQIRNELEDLAIQFLNKEDQEAKCSSLQDLPRTAYNVHREQQLLSITNEIEKMKKYRLGHSSIVSTVLQGKRRDSQKSLVSVKEEASPTVKRTPEKSEENLATGNPYANHNSSLKRQREQELYRVRTELKNLADKLNYTIEDRSKFMSNSSSRSSIKKQAEIIAEDVETAQHV